MLRTVGRLLTGRWSVVGLVVTVVVLAGCAAPVPWEPSDQPGTVDVMTFNIRHGVGNDNVLDLARIAGVIRSAGADVIGLQEVDRHFDARSNFVDQATSLADALGMHVVFGANLDWDPASPGLPRRQYGNAILSLYPIAASENTLLPRSATSEQRGLLHATIDVDGEIVEAYATHLQYDAPAERLLQVDAILDIIGSEAENVVLLGDLNAAPDTPEMALLTEQLVDAWAQAGVGAGATFSSQAPYIRIDYVLTSRRVATRAVAVVATNASDHLPVVATVALAGSQLPVP